MVLDFTRSQLFKHLTLGHEEVVGLAFEKRTPSLSLTLEVKPDLLIIERLMMKIVDTSIFHSKDKDLEDF